MLRILCLFGFFFSGSSWGILMIHTVFEVFMVYYTEQTHFYTNHFLVSMNIAEFSRLYKCNPH